MSQENQEQITEPMARGIDLDLLDGAVAWLNRAVHASGIQLAVEVSEYVVATFFGGDYALMASRDPHKTASFQALCQRADLQFGASTLHRLVRIGQQARRLPADLAHSLSLGHHRALLSVDSGPHKQHLARLAVLHGWTAEKLEATIAAEQPQLPDRPGRPKKPEVLKWLGAVRREVTAQPDVAVFAAHFGQLPATDQGAAKAELQALRQRLDDLLAAIAG